MATPHVAGAAALLLQRHSWTPYQVKSALMSTAGPSWGNTARTQEAPVLLEAQASRRARRRRSKISPTRSRCRSSASTCRPVPAQVDAADDLRLRQRRGDWAATLAPQAQSPGVEIDVPGTFTVPPGRDVAIPVVVRAALDAGLGENFGFVVLTGNGVTRRVPYAFVVERPALRAAPSVALKKLQTGNTASGTNRVSVYCCPAAPFGPPPNYVGATMNEDGAEHLYSVEVNEPIVNFGVSVLASSPGALIDPFVLGSKNESDVQATQEFRPT